MRLGERQLPLEGQEVPILTNVAVPTEATCFDLDNGTRSCYYDGKCYFTGTDGNIGEFPAPNFNDEFLAAAFVMETLSILFSISAVGFLVMNRDKAVLKMSQYQFLILFACTLTVFNISTLIQVIGYLGYRRGICQSFLFLFYTSQMGMMTALWTKTWRAWRVVKSTAKLQRIRITDKTLYSVFFAVEVVTIIPIILWFILDPPKPNPCISLNCSGNMNPYEIVLTVFLALALLVVLVVAVLARNVPSVAGESYGILVTMLVVMIGFIVVFVITTSRLMDTAKTFSFTLYILGVTLTAVSTLIFRKWKYFALDQNALRALFLTAASRQSKSTSQNTEDIRTTGNVEEGAVSKI